MMKKIVVTFLSMLIVVTINVTPMAIAESRHHFEAANATTSIQPRVEETEWIYRTYNGKKQKRLWSITHGYWLTDWIDC